MGRIKLSERTVPEFGYCLFCITSQEARQVRLYESQHEGQRIVKTICDACLGELAAIAQQLGVDPSPEWSLEWPTERGWYWYLRRGWRVPKLAQVVPSREGWLYFGKNGMVAKRTTAWSPAYLPDTTGAMALFEEDADDDLR